MSATTNGHVVPASAETEPDLIGWTGSPGNGGAQIGHARRVGSVWSVTLHGRHGWEPWLKLWCRSVVRQIFGWGDTRVVGTREEAEALLSAAGSRLIATRTGYKAPAPIIDRAPSAGEVIRRANGWA